MNRRSIMALIPLLALLAVPAAPQEATTLAGTKPDDPEASAPAQPEPTADTEDDEDADASIFASAWDWFEKGGPIMYPIALVSLIGLAFVIERAFALRRKNVIPEDVRQLLDERISERDVDGAVALCDDRPCSLGRVVRPALERHAGTVQEMERAAEGAGARELWQMRRNVRPIGVVGTISPLLGLLGTVFGMIGAFQTLSERQTMGNPSIFASDIYQALLTTFFGLSIAIPMVVCFHWLHGKAEAIISEIEEITSDLLLRLQQREETPDPEETP
ncbi:MAG: MotA/TolQ/ExbB proton channel family protein [Planctomycetota bacterium]